MGRPRRVSEPHSGGGWTTGVADAPAPEVRVGRACVSVDHENLDRFGWSEWTDEGRRRVVRSALNFAAEIGVQVVVPPAETPPGLPAGAPLEEHQWEDVALPVRPVDGAAAENLGAPPTSWHCR